MPAQGAASSGVEEGVSDDKKKSLSLNKIKKTSNLSKTSQFLKKAYHYVGSAIKKSAHRFFPRLKNITFLVAKGSGRYFSPSNIMALFREEKALGLRRVLKSSLKYNVINFGIAVLFNIFKFLLLEIMFGAPILRIAQPLVRKIVENTIEPVFEAVRENYFLFLNIVYMKVTHQAIVQSGLIHQETLKSHDKAFLPLLRALRSLSFYVVSFVLGKALYYVNPYMAFVAEAYFLGTALVDYKLSYLGISIEAGQEISAVNNSHYLGLGLSYKLLELLEQSLTKRYFNLQSTYFSSFILQLYIYLVHAQELPLKDPLQQYNCYVARRLPELPVGNGVYLIPGEDVYKKLRQGERIVEGDMVELESLTTPSEETEDGVLIGSEHFTIYFAEQGKWILEGDEQKKTIQIGPTDGRLVKISEEYIKKGETSKKPIIVAKDFESLSWINPAIESLFIEIKSTVQPGMEKWYINYPLQEFSDWLLKTSTKKGIRALNKALKKEASEVQHDQTSQIEHQYPQRIEIERKEKERKKIIEGKEKDRKEAERRKVEQLDLTTLACTMLNKKNRQLTAWQTTNATSWRITNSTLQFFRRQECILLCMEFFKEDFYAFLQFVRDYRYLIHIATQATAQAGQLTQNVGNVIEQVTEAIIGQFDQLKKIPVLSNGIINDSCAAFLKKFDDIANCIPIPRWIVMKVFFSFLPAASIVENINNVSDSFTKFFALEPRVALKILMGCLKVMHRYNVAGAIDHALSLADYVPSKTQADGSAASVKQREPQYGFFQYFVSLEENINIQISSEAEEVRLKDIPAEVCHAMRSVTKSGRTVATLSTPLSIIGNYVESIAPGLSSAPLELASGAYQLLQRTLGLNSFSAQAYTPPSLLLNPFVVPIEEKQNSSNTGISGENFNIGTFSHQPSGSFCPQLHNYRVRSRSVSVDTRTGSVSPPVHTSASISDSPQTIVEPNLVTGSSVRKRSAFKHSKPSGPLAAVSSKIADLKGSLSRSSFAVACTAYQSVTGAIGYRSSGAETPQSPSLAPSTSPSVFSSPELVSRFVTTSPSVEGLPGQTPPLLTLRDGTSSPFDYNLALDDDPLHNDLIVSSAGTLVARKRKG